MFSLQRQIYHLWWSTIETQTRLCGEHRQVEVDCEPVAVDLTPVLVTIRTLDLEIFEREHGEKYLKIKNETPEGCVVRGLLIIRNAEVHLPVVLDPNIDRVVNFGDLNDQVWRVFPKWKEFDQLPRMIQEHAAPKKECERAQKRGSKSEQRSKECYRKFVAGKPVIETALDAFSFLYRCDPSLARTDQSGELEYFPLPQFVEHEYERRHPAWPSRQAVDRKLESEVRSTVPAGVGRRILHRITVGGESIYAGYTDLGNGRLHGFTEAAEQIFLDVQRGYKYTAVSVHGEEVTVRCDAIRGILTAVVDLESFGFASPDDPDEDTWRGWWNLACEDAFYYRRQRSGS